MAALLQGGVARSSSFYKGDGIAVVTALKSKLGKISILLASIAPGIFLLGCTVITLGAILACRPAGSSGTFVPDQRPYRFDAGGAKSPIDKGAIRLAPTDLYNAERGYGWIVPPHAAFTRLATIPFRSDLTQDGVIGRQMVFRADVPPGAWWLTLWMEAGFEDSSTVSLILGDAPRQLAWQAFRPPAEPRGRPQRLYRLYHGRVDIDEGGLNLQLTGNGDSVRVLGLSLTPNPQPTSAAQQAVLDAIRAAGQYGATTPLDSLLAVLGDRLKHDPTEHFAVYWHDQLQQLALVETLYAMMGWEWATEVTGLSIFNRYHQGVMILDGLLARTDRETYPLYERALWHRGRFLYWLGLERHGPHEIAGGKRDLAALYARYPGDQLLAMYNGVPVDLPDICDSLAVVPGAPGWSVAQREALCRLRHEVHWWVNQRQAPNGELGGKIGDDVELLRWWPALVLSGDTVALRGWSKLADAAWESPKVYQGYSARPIDVEHASEFISDTAPEMILYSEEPKYLERLRYSARYFTGLWTGYAPSGRRYFRSAWFSSTEVDTRPPRDRDLEMNTRAMKPVRYLAWKTGDPGIITALHEWSQAWAHAAMRTGKGKPAGIIPASVRLSDEALNGSEPTWYIANMFWDYFDWENRAGSMMLDQLFFTYTLTGDETLLQPLMASLDLIRTHETAGPSHGATSSLTRGSPAWAAATLRANSNFWGTVEQWRLLSGDRRYDDLILRYGTPYVRYRLTGDEQQLTAGLNLLLNNVRYNTPLRTTEVLCTDRVRTPGADHLKAMLTGDGTHESASPYCAASWEGTDEDFTALVTDNGPQQLQVKLFSHGSTPGTVMIRPWQLEPGNYRLRRQSGRGGTEDSTLVLKERGQRVTVALPAQSLLTLAFERIP